MEVTGAKVAVAGVSGGTRLETPRERLAPSVAGNDGYVPGVGLRSLHGGVGVGRASENDVPV
jgi:hypothetical protein